MKASASLLFLITLIAMPAPAAVIPAGADLAERQELIRSNGSEPATLDPQLAEALPDNMITHDLFEGLTAMDNAGRLQAGLAVSWERKNPDTWIFHLRPDARWSDGVPIRAADVVYSIQRLLDPALHSPYANGFGGVLKNGVAVTAGKMPLAEAGVRAVDDYTVELVTAYPVAFLPELLANAQWGPVPRHAIQRWGKDWVNPGKLVSSGAFRLVAWTAGQSIVLEKNRQYWDADSVVLQRVNYLPVEDLGQDVSLYFSGKTDFVFQLPPGQFDKLRLSHPAEVKNSPLLSLRYFSLNLRDPLLRDVRVRKALSMVVDRDKLAESITADGQSPAYSVILQGLRGAAPSSYEWQSWSMADRVAAARQLLKEAGVAPHRQLRLIYNTSDYQKTLSEYLASEWKSKLGLDSQLESTDYPKLMQKRHQGQFQIARNGWTADYNDAISMLGIVRCGDAENVSGGCNQTAEDLIERANLSPDPEQRSALLTEANRLIMQDYTIIPLLQYSDSRLVKPYVGGYGQNPLGRYRSKDIYIIRH
ncbi:peptide ABC transporter substrate-binding protein [Chromobacterium violaceum]|uniref:Periplasmic oligopeptide-binding protein n=1 Tax=Chromobacterium violaceum TaxID=536 RepID=A0AAX2MFA8_CHRVL|nr:peptide ABC transporter substrate-binding protein [Chromobacterium violaceum]MBT2866391.1 peptide ABC transporter substrate-binding protein [Chromobacterium violaceum]MBX9266388.1 peptide ABC transporter substrate-binding protein [Chromobacterium violaceum]OLZ87568.1 peptide ABC transporter substrate-binding protein [Chromobacterium violaceum]OQS11213.1 peptide ABC transporter substrate-binding protein [Chromobacterium violaceum]OQS27638.1 peptide ABC transporter substrate-binding protein [